MVTICVLLLAPRSHGHRRSERQRRPAFDPSGSSVMSSDIETTSFVDSDDDASSRYGFHGNQAAFI